MRGCVQIQTFCTQLVQYSQPPSGLHISHAQNKEDERIVEEESSSHQALHTAQNIPVFRWRRGQEAVRSCLVVGCGCGWVLAHRRHWWKSAQVRHSWCTAVESGVEQVSHAMGMSVCGVLRARIWRTVMGGVGGWGGVAGRGMRGAGSRGEWEGGVCGFEEVRVARGRGKTWWRAEWSGEAERRCGRWCSTGEDTGDVCEPGARARCETLYVSIDGRRDGGRRRIEGGRGGIKSSGSSSSEVSTGAGGVSGSTRSPGFHSPRKTTFSSGLRSLRGRRRTKSSRRLTTIGLVLVFHTRLRHTGHV